MLVDAEADVTCKNFDEMTPSECASMTQAEGYEECIRVLTK